MKNIKELYKNKKGKEIKEIYKENFENEEIFNIVLDLFEKEFNPIYKIACEVENSYTGKLPYEEINIKVKEKIIPLIENTTLLKEFLKYEELFDESNMKYESWITFYLFDLVDRFELDRNIAIGNIEYIKDEVEDIEPWIVDEYFLGVYSDQ